MKRSVIFSVMILFCCAFAAPPPAHAGIIDFFFPSLKKKEVDPSDTLRAPFMELQAQEEGAPPPERPADFNLGLLRDAANAVPLESAHRKDEEIAQWLVVAVSDSLAFDPQGAEAQLAENDVYFSEGGKADYLKFLQESEILRAVQSGRYQIRNFVQDDPLMLNKGAVSGRYRWLFEVPVMLSYIDSSATTYEKVEPVNQILDIKIQVGRVPEKRGENNILIERWSGTVQPSGE